MSCVLDSSTALAWVLPGESSPALDAVLDQVEKTGAVVPGLWPLEVANVLLIAERRGRMTRMQRDEALALLAELPIRIDSQTIQRGWGDTLKLAQAAHLTVYDACYLEAAIRLKLPLASLDRQLREAASAVGITVLG